MAKKYYAVKVGRVPGIYENEEEYAKQIKGFSGFLAKGFNSLDAAKVWMGILDSTVLENTNTRYYAVRVGRKIGVYTNLKTYREQVDGFSRAESKLFKDHDAAEQWINEGKCEKLTTENEAIAYVDGSYDEAKNMYSYGAVIIHRDKRYYLNGCKSDTEMAKLHNIAGELESAMQAIAWSKCLNIQSLRIVHDCEAISLLALGDSKVREGTTAEYKKFYETASKTIDIQFCKTKAHSSDRYNDMADALARHALGKKIKKSLADYIFEETKEVVA